MTFEEVIVIAVIVAAIITIIHCQRTKANMNKDEPVDIAEGYSTDAPPTVEYHYVPWCGYCKKLDPVWEQVVKSLAHTNIVFVKVNQEDVKEQHGQYSSDVHSFPTIFGISHGMKRKYTGQRTFDELRGWALNL